MRNAPLQAAFLSINAEGLTYKRGVTTLEELGTRQREQNKRRFETKFSEKCPRTLFRRCCHGAPTKQD
ncbi:hypothetical protein CEXT_79821 [Caerostris extrusa]|uniref:Uncharacterized protein n=1 Tax=Caerostris extrusa TaxID=172846 RepID=A0AAV4RCM0_CAEEX|nr:hypothetical protein CEXT_79821 [Caerostris extrusa]